MRSLSREDLERPADDRHIVNTFERDGITITEHVFIGFDVDTNVVVWDSGPKPRPLVHNAFGGKPSDKNFESQLIFAKECISNTFDGVDWEWWADRFATIEKGEQTEQESGEEE
jgi:hypothetical protein